MDPLRRLPCFRVVVQTLCTVAVSQITRMELLSFHGLTTSEEARLNALLGVITVIMIDAQVEQQAIVLRRSLRLKLPDAIVAASALVAGLELLTLDQNLAKTLSRA